MREIAKIGVNSNDLQNCKSTNTVNKKDCSNSVSIFNSKRPVTKCDNQDNDASRIKVLNSKSSIKVLPATDKSDLSFEEKQNILREANNDPLNREQKLRQIEKNIQGNKYKNENTDKNSEVSNKKSESTSNKKDSDTLTEDEKYFAKMVDPRKIGLDMCK